MAERSKAPVSGTGLFGGVGSNPTSIMFFSEVTLSFLFLPFLFTAKLWTGLRKRKRGKGK
jgi:hypothetical protein